MHELIVVFLNGKYNQFPLIMIFKYKNKKSEQFL